MGFAPTRHPSYSPHLSHLFAGSGPFGFERLPLKPLHMSWTTRHPSRPTGKSWNVVPAAGEHNAWGTIKRHPATYLNHGPRSSLVSSQGATSPPLPNGCGRELIGPSLYRDQKGKASGVRHATGADRATKEGKASGRSDRHCHLPSASGEARGASEIQGVPVDELQEYLYP